MNPLISIAVQAARAAGRIIVKASERPDLIKISTKGATDFTTDVDQKAEQAIIDTIKKAYPHHAILAEESGVHGDDSIQWIIDPLDGTKNFMHHCPHYAVSIAVQIDGRTEHAVVYDPVRDELFFASLGRGAQLNGHRLRLAQRPAEQSMIAITYPTTDAQSALDLAKKIALLAPIASGVRKMGSAALDLAYLAAGRFDVCIATKLQLWDFAAGALLVTEAGGIISDWTGKTDYVADGTLYATHPKLFKRFLPMLS